MAIGWIKEAAELGIKVFGDVNYRGPCPHEMAEQLSFLGLLEQYYPEYACVAVHIANEGKRSKRKGQQMKMEGMKKGACDIFIPCKPPLLIELKRRDPTKSRISIDQIKYILNAKKIGANACVAIGAVGAFEAVKHYMGDPIVTRE